MTARMSSIVPDRTHTLGRFIDSACPLAMAPFFATYRLALGDPRVEMVRGVDGVEADSIHFLDEHVAGEGNLV